MRRPILALAIVVLALIGGCAGWAWYHGHAQAVASLAPAETAEIVGTTWLSNQYRDNPVAAESKYWGRRINLREDLGAIRKDGDSAVLVIGPLEARFHSSQVPTLTTLRVGELVHVVCDCCEKGFGALTARNCRLIDHSP